MEFKKIFEWLKRELDGEIQKDFEIYDDVSTELNDELEKCKIEQVASGLNVHEHRWFEDSTNVYKVTIDSKDYFFGVNGVSKIYSESSGLQDLFYSWSVFLMKAKTVTVIKYERE